MSPRTHSLLTLAAITLALACGSARSAEKAATEKCETETALKDAGGSKDAIEALSAAFNFSSCGSVQTILRMLNTKSTVGGRKLEKDRPLDVPAAEAERAAALNDPDFKAALDSALASESLPLRRLVLEAAAHHEAAQFKARDLVLKQVRQLAGIQQ